jgi:hypothetical protein
MRVLKQAIGQSGFAVIDVSDDGKVPDLRKHGFILSQLNRVDMKIVIVDNTFRHEEGFFVAVGH